MKKDESEKTTTETVKKSVVPKADQDQIQANDAGEVERQIEAVLQSPETAALVAGRGYDAKKLRVGSGLVASFQEKVNVRQQEMGSLQGGSATLKAATGDLKLKVADLRESARVAYPKDPAARQALGATEKVPQDQEKLLVYARTCAEAARKAHHAAALREVGFDSGGFDAAISAFAGARVAATVAEQSAKRATAERDAAYRELKDWAQPFRRIVKLALKARPDLLTPLGL